jgi:Ca2+-binding EF-hand superfamily protein
MGVTCGGRKNISRNQVLQNPSKPEEFEIEDNKRGSLCIIRDRTGKLVYARRDYLILSETVQELMNKYYLEIKDLGKLWAFFKSVDHTRSGYITLKEIYLVLGQNPSISIVGPVLDRFFALIEKEFKDKVTFEEFVPNLISFCLFSKFQIREFMFSIFDTNNDCLVNRNDLIKFFSVKKDGKEVYFKNYIDAITNYPFLERSDKINFEDFIEICHDLQFICYPAEKLQNLFKNNFVSLKFWNKLHKVVIDRYKQHLYVNNKKIKEKLDEIKLNEKIENYKKNLNEDGNGTQLVYRNNVRINKLKRTLSDTNFYHNKKINRKESEINSLDNISIKHILFEKENVIENDEY